MNDRTKGALLTLFGGMCWGLSGSCGEYLFTVKGMDSRWLVPIRLGIAGVVLLLYCAYKYGKTTIEIWKKKEDIIDLLIYGLAGVSMCQFLYFSTIQLSSAAAGTILQDLSPVMILLSSCYLAHRKPKRYESAAVFFALLGVFLLSTHGDLTHLAIAPAAILTGVLCAVCVTIYNVYPKRLLNTWPITVLQGWAFLLGSIFFTVLFRPWNYHYIPDTAGYLGIGFVVLIGNVLAFPCYMAGVRMIGPEKGILYGFSEPVTAALVSSLVLKTSFTVYDLLGFASMFVMLKIITSENP